jgi:hypothetical protein
MTTVRNLGWLSLSLASFLLMTATAPSWAQDKPPATVKVEKGPIRVETILKGVVEAESGSELVLRPEAWASPLTVLKAVEHGAEVKKGDVLIEFNLEKIDQAIKDLKIDQGLGMLSLKQAEEELPLLERLLPLDLAAAEREKKQSDEDLIKFLEIDRPQSEKMANFQLKSASYYLEYAKEELSQLQKMYRSKDLTEDTEEMILKRQRHQVEASEFGLKNAEIQRETTLKVALPRQEQQVRDGVVRQAVSLEKAKLTLPLTLSQKRVALLKLRMEGERTAEKLADLQKDRALMTVHAPRDGIVFYGKAFNGSWAGATSLIPRLQEGGTVAPSEVFMTVVAPRPVFVRASVEEKDLHSLKTGLTGKAIPVGYPETKIPAKLAKISAIPLGPGVFEARIALDFDKVEGPDAISPGMACSTSFVSYKKEDALTVPATSVFVDEKDDSHFVYLPVKDGKPVKKTITVGKTAGSKMEVVEGLKEGDEVLAAKP